MKIKNVIGIVVPLLAMLLSLSLFGYLTEQDKAFKKASDGLIEVNATITDVYYADFVWQESNYYYEFLGAYDTTYSGNYHTRGKLISGEQISVWYSPNELNLVYDMPVFEKTFLIVTSILLMVLGIIFELKAFGVFSVKQQYTVKAIRVEE